MILNFIIILHSFKYCFYYFPNLSEITDQMSYKFTVPSLGDVDLSAATGILF